MKVHEFERLVSKLTLQIRNSRDRLAWFVHEGRVITRTKRSHGRGDLPQDLIRQQLRLTQQELADIIGCKSARNEYITILRNKGLI